MDSPILARADALMKRRRQSNVEVDDVPLLTDAISPDDDIPLLLDVVPPVPLAEIAPAIEPEVETVTESATISEPIPEPATDLALEGEMLDIVAHELARRVHERLAAELPAIIETTIRDFLAEPDILALIQPRD
ncbi:MAG TPA: hypothetical protein PLU47_06190 [Azonexus sp.]|nr:hypothetical protein [Azonexus sp.]